MKPEKKQGDPEQTCTQPIQRYCQTLDLKDEPALIQEYIKRHSPTHHWPEIREGIRSVGILEMEIYHLDTKLFMIVDTPLDFEWEKAFEKLACLPRQEEWEKYVAFCQKVAPNAFSSEKWTLMERIFHLYK